jgi:hypothetical protein
MPMTTNKGKRAGALIPESSLSDRLGEPKLDRNIQQRIGDQLRQMYDGLADQPIPDRFKELLGRLDGPNKDPSEGEGR